MAKIEFKKYLKLILFSAAIGMISALLADSLKEVTEIYENEFYGNSVSQPIMFFIFPLTGLFVIYLFRHLFFKKIQNKGLKEIMGVLKADNADLPFYKIPSHFCNGFLTVAFGGSTGIEVSTVVASSTLGSLSNKKFKFLKEYKTELICAGAAAGITALFNTPLAGILFSFEVLSKKITRSSLFIQTIAVASAFVVNYFLNEGSMFRISGLHWNVHAIPYFMMLGLLAGLNSAYLTRSVIMIKKISAGSNNEKLRILFGALIVGLLLFIFPSLYGEGYRTIQEFIKNHDSIKISNALIAGLCAVLFLKPIVTSITLSIGGDGGIFAPSLFIGAFLGLIVSLLLNYFFNADVVILNFILVGMAAVLSSSIHAPLTAIFLICGLTSNYDLLFPLFITCFISKFIAAKIIPYTVYSYSGQ